MNQLLDFILHLDRHLQTIVEQHGAIWAYLLLFAFLFAETGFVVTPFLPGDSLVFAVGALAAAGVPLSPVGSFVVLVLGAILGDSLNYEIGKRLAPRLAHGGHVPLLKSEHLERAEKFFQKYGGKAIILARFVPIVRTFAPFVAGAGNMPYRRFLAFNVVGGLLWVSLFLAGGYFVGNSPFVKGHFGLALAGIIAVSLVPALYEFWRVRQEKPEEPADSAAKRAVRT